MSFGGLFDAGVTGATLSPYSAGGIAPPRRLSTLNANSSFSSPGLSLGLRRNTEGEASMSRFGFLSGDPDALREIEMMRTRANLVEVTTLKAVLATISTQRTLSSIVFLSWGSLFKECPHPDEKQRMELSKRLNLDPRQVKFWFQNRRTQMKTQIERHENSILRAENDKLRAENLTIREAMRNPLCGTCGSPAMLGEVSRRAASEN
ncbi:hypothetical protein HPP92_008166 [Vanilla planifolia]|uniref:Homeobox domain-containing protein n=1 Tax=Vanilla planifolia TaxID=51239 RepID=A0A835V7N0_VANPL|nr:hypothetical protein HPP92_008166 [Vanilla planifolia]